MQGGLHKLKDTGLMELRDWMADINRTPPKSKFDLLFGTLPDKLKRNEDGKVTFDLDHPRIQSLMLDCSRIMISEESEAFFVKIFGQGWRSKIKSHE